MGQRSIGRIARWPALIAAAASLAGHVAGLGAADSGYYDRKEQGWFWHEPDPVPMPQPPALPEAEQPAQESILPAPEPPRAQQLEPLSSAWLREKLPEFRDRAMDHPTPDNVRAYYTLQRYAMDMAQRFAMTAQQVVQSDPRLDENSLRPISTYGAQVFDEVAREKTLAVARKIAAMAGVWYFFRSDCPYCRAQNPILERLQRRVGLAVLPISLDGKAMPEGAFAHYVPNQGHAELLKVKATPTLFLVRKPNEFALVSEGLLTDDGLLERMILAAHEAGWISDEEFNATRPMKPPEMTAVNLELNADVLADPVRLIEALQPRAASSDASSTLLSP